VADFFEDASNRLNSLYTELRIRFGRLFGAERAVERNTFGTSPYYELQKTVDGFTDWKRAVIRYSEIALTDYTTIYDFFFLLDQSMMAYEKAKKEMQKDKMKNKKF